MRVSIQHVNHSVWRNNCNLRNVEILYRLTHGMRLFACIIGSSWVRLFSLESRLSVITTCKSPKIQMNCYTLINASFASLQLLLLNICDWSASAELCNTDNDSGGIDKDDTSISHIIDPTFIFMTIIQPTLKPSQAYRVANETVVSHNFSLPFIISIHRNGYGNY